MSWRAISDLNMQQPLQRQISETDFQCHCCYQLMVHPTSLTCGHTFCRLCLAQWFLQCRKRQCLECRQTWHGNPEINIALRSAINSLFPNVAEKQLQQDCDPSATNVIRTYEQALREQQHQHQLQQQPVVLAQQLQNLVTFCKGVGVAVLALGGLWLVYDILQAVGSEALVLKPVSKWSKEDVMVWLEELGPWTQDTLIPVFQNESIDGRLLLALDAEDLDLLLENREHSSLHRRAFLTALASLSEDGIKAPKNLWEFKSRHLAKTMLFSHSLVVHPRLAMFVMYFYDYEDSFLPFVHSTCPVIDNMYDLCLYSFKFEPPSLRQWIDFLIKWLLFPYYLIACFIWRVVFWQHWLLAPYYLCYCLLLTLMEAQSFLEHWKHQRLVPSWSSVLMYLKTLRVYLLVAVCWHFIPTFICTAVFYMQLLLLPACSLYNYIKLGKRLW